MEKVELGIYEIDKPEIILTFDELIKLYEEVDIS